MLLLFRFTPRLDDRQGGTGERLEDRRNTDDLREDDPSEGTGDSPYLVEPARLLVLPRDGKSMPPLFRGT
jgi:hypothetical protein